MGEIKKISDDEYFKTPGLSIHALMEADPSSGGSMCYLKDYQNKNWDDSSWNEGRAIHEAVLQPEIFSDKYMLQVYKKDNPIVYERQQRLIETGKVQLITQIRHDTVMSVVNGIENDPENAFARTFLQGDKEVSLFCDHPDYGFQMKSKLDVMNRKKKYICDLKSIGRKMSNHALQGMFYKQKWAWQAAYYKYVTKIVTGDDYDFYFVCVETDSPYKAYVMKLDDSAIDLAWTKMEPLFPVYAECLKTGYFPGRQLAVQTLFEPGYAFSEDNLE